MKLCSLFRSFRLKSLGRAFALKERIGRTDLGVLKVAFMVAALDGEVTDDEYEVFDRLLKKCRGYTPAGGKRAFDEALRSAGYLMLKSRRVKEAELVKAFVVEAEAALPDGFAYLSVEDVRRAFVTWVAMAMGDGDYSRRERRAIEALRRHFAEDRVHRNDVETMRWLELSSAYRDAFAPGLDTAEAAMQVTRDFVGRVERLMTEYGTSAEAEHELKAILAD